jgi:hypothetical protein
MYIANLNETNENSKTPMKIQKRDQTIQEVGEYSAASQTENCNKGHAEI